MSSLPLNVNIGSETSCLPSVLIIWDAQIVRLALKSPPSINYFPKYLRSFSQCSTLVIPCFSFYEEEYKVGLLSFITVKFMVIVVACIMHTVLIEFLLHEVLDIL